MSSAARARVAGHDRVVEERAQQQGLQGDEGGGGRLGEDDEEGLPPVGPQVAGGRPQEIEHRGGS